MLTESEIRRFIEQELMQTPLEGRDPLAEEALDSLNVERLIAFLEERFEIQLADEELVAENFSSIAAVAALVDMKRGAPHEGNAAGATA